MGKPLDSCIDVNSLHPGLSSLLKTIKHITLESTKITLLGQNFFVMLFIYGGRFFSVESLENVFTQSLFGKNLCGHQPFDYDSEGSLSTEDRRPVKDQCLQNLIAHWAPKFMVDAFNDLVHKP